MAAMNRRGRRIRAVYCPDRDQRQPGVGDDLNLGLERRDRHVVREDVVARLDVGRRQHEAEPDIQQHADRVLEDVRQDEVRVDDRVEVALDPAELEIELFEKAQIHRSVRRDRARENADKRAGDFDADGADDDALDPLLGRQRGLRFDRGDLPDEREDERERSDRTNERLPDVDPRAYEIGDRLNVGLCSEKEHLAPPGFGGKLRVRARRWNPGC
jgi:hypothetical protein